MKETKLIHIKSKKVFYVYGIMLSILVLSSIALTIASATKGAEISYLEKQKKEARLEQDELLSKVITGTSLSQISSEAQQMGLVKAENIIYLNHPEIVASLR
ncbi:hypothetical protein KW795_03110 [Candidatus Microgenomates bacterium]|nr:hypothetical protein [Candidatus Microgenomates bacterium]